MSDSSNQVPPPPPPAGDPAAKAKEMYAQAAATFRGFDPMAQLYLAAMAVSFLLSLLFQGAKADLDLPPEVRAAMEAGGGASSFGMRMIQDFTGVLALLAQIAGIGLLLAITVGKQTLAWAPIALLGCAGLVVLMFLVFFFRASSPFIDMDMGILGFYLPFLAALAATYAAFMRFSSQR